MITLNEILENYQSPVDECSEFKGIPIEFAKEALALLPTENRRIRYRGPSTPTHRRNQSYCLQSAATSIAVYYDNYKSFYV